MLDREAHFPFTYVKLDKDEIKRKEKEHEQNMQTFTTLKKDLIKKKGQNLQVVSRF